MIIDTVLEHTNATTKLTTYTYMSYSIYKDNIHIVLTKETKSYIVNLVYTCSLDIIYGSYTKYIFENKEKRNI